jgi:hypothetical protein
MSAWLGWSTSADAAEWLAQADRTDNIALLVGLRGASVVLVRGATALAAQNMIIVPAAASSTSSEAGKDSGTAAREQVLLVGESSLNVRRGDRFSYGAIPTGRLNYEVLRVERLHTGMIQAFAEVVD